MANMSTADITTIYSRVEAPLRFHHTPSLGFICPPPSPLRPQISEIRDRSRSLPGPPSFPKELDQNHGCLNCFLDDLPRQRHAPWESRLDPEESGEKQE